MIDRFVILVKAEHIIKTAVGTETAPNRIGYVEYFITRCVPYVLPPGTFFFFA